MKPKTRPSFSDLTTALMQSLRRLTPDHRLRGRARLAFVIVACLLIGLIGPVITALLRPEATDAEQIPPQLAWIDWWYVVPSVLGIILAILRSGQFIKQMYSLGSLWHGVRFVLSTVFGIGETKITVSYGEIVRPDANQYCEEFVEKDEAARKIGGPARLSVTRESAVITERGGGFGRILGPGTYMLSSFERVRHAFDLRPQSLSDDEPAVVLTKDGIPVTVRVMTMLRLTDRMEGEGDPPPQRPGFKLLLRAYLGRKIKREEWMALKNTFPVSREALRSAAYRLPADATWSTVAHGTVSGSVREEITRRLLDQLFEPDSPDLCPRKEITDKIFVQSKASLDESGIDLLNIHFDNIHVPAEVVKQRRDSWGAIWQNKSKITRADGEAEWIYQHNLAKAEAQVEMIYAITHALRTIGESREGGELHPLIKRFIEVVVKAIDGAMNESSQKVLSQSEIDSILKELRQVLAKDDKDPRKSAWRTLSQAKKNEILENLRRALSRLLRK